MILKCCICFNLYFTFSYLYCINFYAIFCLIFWHVFYVFFKQCSKMLRCIQVYGFESFLFRFDIDANPSITPHFCFIFILQGLNLEVHFSLDLQGVYGNCVVRMCTTRYTFLCDLWGLTLIYRHFCV